MLPAMQSRWSLAWAQRDHLLRVARRRTLCEDEAQDAVSEAMVRAMQADQLDETRIAAWLTTVTVNLCADIARDRARWHTRAAKYAVIHGGTEPSPEQRILDRELAAAVVRRLNRLPARQREAILLRASGLGVTDIAETLEVPYRAAESLLTRARAALRKAAVAAVAGLASGWGIARRASRQAPLSATVALAAAAAVVTPAFDTPARVQAATPLSEAPLTVYMTAQGHATNHAAPARAPGSHDDATRHASEKRTSRHAARSVVQPMRIGARGYGVDVGGVTQHDVPTSLPALVLDCVRHAQLTPQHVGCPT